MVSDDDIASAVTNADSLSSLRERIYEVDENDETFAVGTQRLVDTVGSLEDCIRNEQPVDDPIVQRYIDDFPTQFQDHVHTLYVGALDAQADDDDDIIEA